MVLVKHGILVPVGMKLFTNSEKELAVKNYPVMLIFVVDKLVIIFKSNITKQKIEKMYLQLY